MRFWLPLLAALFPALAGGATAQTPPPPVPATAALPRITLSAQSLAGLPRKTLAVVDENGKNVTYSGVDLGALLAAGGAPHGEALRGRAVADGYRAVFALIELDPRFTDKVVLLADRQDGAAIGKDGPFRLVVPDEKHHARWVRNVVDVQVLSPP
jgi:hypothetical protein